MRIRHEVKIIWTNTDLLSTGPLGTNLGNQNTATFIKERWFENIIWEVVTICLCLDVFMKVEFCVSKFRHHWFICCLVAHPVKPHHQNQCWLIVNWTIGNEYHWNLNQNRMTFVQENNFEYIVWEPAVILSRPKCVYCIIFYDVLAKSTKKCVCVHHRQPISYIEIFLDAWINYSRHIYTHGYLE